MTMALERIVKPHILDLAPYEPGKPVEELERELGLSGSIKLASNESPLGPSPKAVAALQKAIGGIHRYPDGASFELRRKLADRLAVEAEQLVFGAGADEILELLAKVLLGPGDECVFAWPSFAMYPIVVKGMGAQAVQVPLDGELRPRPAGDGAGADGAHEARHRLQSEQSHRDERGGGCLRLLHLPASGRS